MAIYGYLWLLWGSENAAVLVKVGPKSPELRLHKMVPWKPVGYWSQLVPTKKRISFARCCIIFTPNKKQTAGDCSFLHHKKQVVNDGCGCYLHPWQEVRATKLLGTPASCAQDRPMTSWLTRKPRNTTRGHDLVHVCIYIYMLWYSIYSMSFYYI